MMKILEGINWFWGAIVAVLSAVFGIYWYFFAALLLLNFVDCGTGWYNARKRGTESSNKGAKGAVKKSRLLGYNWSCVLFRICF